MWHRQTTHAFRKGIKSGLLQRGAHVDAIDYLEPELAQKLRIEAVMERADMSAIVIDALNAYFE